MSSKAKRRSTGNLESLGTHKKSNKGSSYGMRWEGSTLHATIPPGKELAFLGEATLHVTSGSARVNGAILGPDSPGCFLGADVGSTGPLAIALVPEEGQFPYAPACKGLSLVLHALEPAERMAAGSAGVVAPAREPGFQVWLDDDPAAPPCPLLPDLWHDAAEEVVAMTAPGAVVAVVGPKKVGKSTFGRLLINHLLATHDSVAYLETDCGQPEFGPPGLVSLNLVTSPLTGPPALHPATRPLAAYFIGDVSPASDAARYAACVAALCAAHAAHSPPCPMVVNTHGWTRGTGLDLLRGLLAAARPACVVQVSSGDARRDLPPGAWWLDEPGDSHAQATPAPHTWLVPPLGGALGMPAPPSPAASGRSVGDPGRDAQRGLTPVELRAAAWAAFARRCAGSLGQGPALAAGASPADALAASPPYAAPWDDVRVQSLFTRPLEPDQTARALNAAVVGLCRSDARDGDVRAGEGAAPASDPGPRCLGVGIVRAVDGAARRLLLLTLLPAEELEGVDLLQLGRLELPGLLLQSASLRSPYMAQHCLSTLGTGAGTGKSRNNLARAGQQDRGG